MTATMAGKTEAATNMMNDHHVRGVGRYHSKVITPTATRIATAMTAVAVAMRMCLCGLTDVANHIGPDGGPIEVATYVWSSWSTLHLGRSEYPSRGR